MIARVEPAAAETDCTEDQAASGQEGPQRLPLLWTICVLYGFLGCVFAYKAFPRSPFVADASLSTGPAVMAVVFFALALGLWLRWNPARFVAIASMAVSFGFWMYVLCRFGMHKNDPNPFFAPAWGVIAAYLFTLGKHFRSGDRQGPGLLSWSFLASVVTVILLFMRGLTNGATWVSG
ncbi:MAG: hypothetical protein R6V05_08525 [Candidatus Brocadiia bacterium]